MFSDTNMSPHSIQTLNLQTVKELLNGICIFMVSDHLLLVCELKRTNGRASSTYCADCYILKFII